MPEFIQSTLRFDPELHDRLRIAVIKRKRKTIQEVIFEAIENWLGDEDTPAASSAPVLTDRTKEETLWCNKLVDLLREGDAASIEIVQHALDRHARIARERRKRASQ